MSDFESLLPVAVLAGGLATRLRPLTETLPKSLLPINEIPFIDHQLRLLQKQGIKKVVLCLGYLGEQVQTYVGDGKQYGLNIRYSFDGEQLLGTAGSLKKALPHLGEAFFVCYGDSYLLTHYKNVQKAYFLSGKSALMTIYRNRDQWDTSNVEYRDGVLLAYDKKNRTARMQHIDYGLGILKADALSNIPDDKPSDLAELYQQLLAKQQLASFEVTERFYEVGSHTGIQDLSNYLKEGA
jgi:N-acetyl-alpha-D-muramate 1-phosphate uridylyltransferase